MEIQNNPVLEITAQNEAAVAQQSFGAQALGREEFLKLLIAQLEHQDPMQPAKDTEFVAQLATFSSLEQQIATNDNLQMLALGQASLVNAQALNLIGKEALIAANDTIDIRDGRPDALVYALPRDAASATLTVFGPDNTPVRTFQLSTAADGRVTLDWDGTDGEGNVLDDGTYRFEVNATDLEGKSMSVALFKALPIEAVTFSENGVGLVSGDREIAFDLIMEIRAAQPASPPQRRRS